MPLGGSARSNDVRDVKTYLVDDILTKVNKMSMAVSLEARVPLRDHKLLKFAATVPTTLQIRNGRSKYLLRRLLERRVPKAIVDRRFAESNSSARHASYVAASGAI